MGTIRDIKSCFATPEVFRIYALCMYMPTPEKFHARADQYVSTPTVSIFGFFEDEQIAGVIVVDRPEGEMPEIRGIAVDPDYRKRSIGKRLIQYSCEVLSISTLLAETDDNAVDFYRQCGFHSTGFIHDGGYKRYRCVLDVIQQGINA